MIFVSGEPTWEELSVLPKGLPWGLIDRAGTSARGAGGSRST